MDLTALMMLMSDVIDRCQMLLTEVWLVNGNPTDVVREMRANEVNRSMN